MTDREKLIELIKQKSCVYNECEKSCSMCDCIEIYDSSIETIADYLLDNGVIVLPCKVGDTVYYAGIDTPVEFTVIGFSKGRMYGCSVADYEEFVEDNELNVDEWYVHLDSFCGLRQMSPLSSFGKRLFVGADAEKEAEKALAERSLNDA